MAFQILWAVQNQFMSTGIVPTSDANGLCATTRNENNPMHHANNTQICPTPQILFYDHSTALENKRALIDKNRHNKMELVAEVLPVYLRH